MSTLHDRLAAARKHAGFSSAAEAAAALGVKYPTYAGHENGSSGFRGATGELYARRFGVRFEWLMTGKGAMVGEGTGPIRGDTAILAMLARIEGLTDTDISVAFAVIKNALQAKQGAQVPSGSHDPQPRANRRRESEPSR